MPTRIAPICRQAKKMLVNLDVLAREHADRVALADAQALHGRPQSRRAVSDL